MKTILLIAAGVLIVFGGLFTLQGLGIVGGSAMSGNPTWAVIGPILMVIGLFLGGWALRRGARAR
jgi:hypothetical protein